MKKRIWIKIKKDGKFPDEKKPVYIFANDGKGNFMVYTAHHEKHVWFIYDHFSNQFRIYTRQQYITHWKLMDEFPSFSIKKDLKK
jgi:hypothetical protein